jgi:hypothetical protein
MGTVDTARHLAVGLLGLIAAGCGPAGKAPGDVALAPDMQAFGQPRVETAATQRTAQQALAGAALSGNGAVPVIMFKNNAAWVENVFAARPSMADCEKLMDAHIKSVRSSAAAGPASYYCVPVQRGQIGQPKLVAQYSS